MENFIVSARKYRPASFDTVVGQLAITSTLRNAIVNHQLAQAYLFTGPRGVGKTTCARIFAKTINCLNLQPNAEPCNECESCKAFNAGRSLNIHELDAASNNSVDDIRGLVEQVRILPQVGKYSVYIIDEVHMLSIGAFNALLKTLEEPPSYVIFILATTEVHKIPITILSRCQRYDFHRISIETISARLTELLEKENVTAEERAVRYIAKAADGLDFPFDFPFDFANEKRGSEVFEVDHIISSDFEMTIYGPCVNPRVLINGYPYEVLTTLEAGEYLVINSAEQTVVKHLNNGLISNLFDVRGYEYSIFNKIPSGMIRMNWTGDYGIDLVLYLKRREAAW